MDFEMIVSPPASTSMPSQGARDALQQWLNGAQLPEYLDAFLAEGFDLDLLCAHGLNEADLIAMGITKRGHIKLLLAAAEDLRNPLSHRRLTQRTGEDRTDPSKPASTPEFKQLLDFSARNMMLSLDQERACTYLEVACKYGDETLKAVCLDFIEKNAVAVLSSQDFLKASQPSLELILQCPNLDVDEILLFQALLRWKGAVALRDLTPLGKLIRFGAIPPKDLLHIVEPAGVATNEQLLAAYRYHATPGSAPSLATNPFFCNRKKATDPKPLDLSRNPEVQNIFPVPVRGNVWKMTMSTSYPGLPNNYETLTDDKPCFPGCATNYGANQWVQATFDRPVLVSKVKLSAPNQGEFVSQGWGDSYLVGTEIQITMDEKNWETVARCDKANSTGFTEVVLQQSKMSRFWRLFKPNGYIATGSLIFE